MDSFSTPDSTGICWRTATKASFVALIFILGFWLIDPSAEQKAAHAANPAVKAVRGEIAVY